MRWFLKFSGKKRTFFGAGLIFLLIGAGAFYFSKKSASVDYPGSIAENFALMDPQGRMMELYRHHQDSAVVLISYGMGCPIVRKSIPKINEFVGKYADKKVKFYFIDSNPQDGRDALEKEAAEFAIQPPILRDDAQLVARSMGIVRTGEVLIVQPKTWKIVYRGPIDDRLGYGFEKPIADKNYFEDALSALLAGRKIEENQVNSLGCAITFEEYEDIDYAQDVAPIVQRRCGGCHQEGGMPPTNFWTYKDLKGWSKMLKEVIRTEQMPPWEVDEYYGKVRGRHALTPEEKQKIFAWIDEGHPRGEVLKQLPNARRWPVIREDFQWAMKKEIEITAQTQELWHYEPLIEKSEKDIWIAGIKPQMSNQGLVQHYALIITRDPLDTSKNDFQPQFSQQTEIYNIIRMPVANRSLSLDEGLAFKIPKNSYVYLELHFRPTGKTEKQMVRLGVQEYKLKKPPNEILYSPIVPWTKGTVLPANTESFVIKKSKKVSTDTYLWSVGPHMHWRGVSAKLTEILEDNTRKILFSSRYLFKFRRTYEFKEPVLVRAGSTLEVELEFNNSPSNPAQIDTSQTVSYGPDALKHEMGVFHINWFVKK